MKVAVIGAGVIGLGSAVVVAEHFGNSVDITLIAEEISPNTTGDGSAGLWGPYILGNTPKNAVLKVDEHWSKVTFDFFHTLWKNGDAFETGISLQSVTRLTTETIGYMPYWKDIVFGSTELNDRQLARYSKEYQRNYTGGVSFTTFTCEPIRMLPYLFKRFTAAGGKFTQRRIRSIEKLADEGDYDVVINCSGLGAKELVSDNEVKPVRGQVIRVEAPWVYEVIMDDSNDGNYVIPNMSSIVLGGTHQDNDFNRVPVDVDRNFILNGCTKMVPSLNNAKILHDWVGLRPGRICLRLEAVTIKTVTGRSVKVIHNYGHGGSGVTLFWGCAFDVLKMLK